MMISIPSSGTAGQALSFSLSAMDVWSPLGATTWSFGDGQSASGTSVSHAYANAGTYTVAVTSADTLGNTTSTSASVTITGGKVAPVIVTSAAPQLTGAHLTHTRFRVSKHPTAVSASARRKPPLGTTFRFTLSEAAKVQIVFTRSALGLRSAERCVASTPSLKRQHAPHCTRTLTVGRLTRAHEGQGADSLTFSGRIGTHALAPRAYQATLTAIANGLASTPSKLALTIAP